MFEKAIFLTFKVMITNLGRVLTLEYCVWNFAKRFSFETSAKLLITEPLCNGRIFKKYFIKVVTVIVTAQKKK